MWSPAFLGCIVFCGAEHVSNETNEFQLRSGRSFWRSLHHFRLLNSPFRNRCPTFRYLFLYFAGEISDPFHSCSVYIFSGLNTTPGIGPISSLLSFFLCSFIWLFLVGLLHSVNCWLWRHVHPFNIIPFFRRGRSNASNEMRTQSRITRHLRHFFRGKLLVANSAGKTRFSER